MFNTIILIIALLLVGVCTMCAIILTQMEKKERIKTENKLNEVYKNEEKTAEIISNANKTKEDARTGNHSNDLHFMADKLHDYANK